jgi:hypothetical protein
MNGSRGVIAACVLAVTLAFTATAQEKPLTNEDIVRMVASGTPEEQVREAIRSHSEAFELSGDMIEELKLAGVPETILAAMAKRHAENAPAAVPAPRESPGRATVVVTLKGGEGASRTIRVPGWADEDAKEMFNLPKETEQREVKDLAVFLACVSSDHVPDLWRSKSPLGRDTSTIKRHEMLAFVPGDTPPGKAPRIQLPARLEAEVDDSEPHDLVLGIAARIGDRWVQLGAAVLKQSTIVAGGKPLSGRIDRVGHGFAFKIELAAAR